MRITPHPASAHSAAMPGSRRKPETSLITSAPCASTSRATSLFTESTEIGVSGFDSRSASITGSTRRSSSSTLTATRALRTGGLAADVEQVGALRHQQSPVRERPRVVKRTYPRR